MYKRQRQQIAYEQDDYNRARLQQQLDQALESREERLARLELEDQKEACLLYTSMEGRFLFITPTVLGLIQDMDTTHSREVLARFDSVVQVPQTRFYTAIEQLSGLSGESGDESAGGYRKADAGKDINFLVIHRDAPIQFTKHLAPKVIPPEANPAADAWKFGYRMVGIADAYENKAAGIYLHHKA